MTDPRLGPKAIKARISREGGITTTFDQMVVALDVCRAIAEAPEPKFIGGMPDFDVGIVLTWWEACRTLVGEDKDDG